MEIWLILAIVSSVGSGVAGFILKIVARNNESSELNIFYGGVFGILILVPTAYLLYGTSDLSYPVVILSLLSGFIASFSAVFKIYALRHIDTTIYFPLFKIVSPVIAIALGILFFQEEFTSLEWIGLIVSLLVPLMLITKSENRRQNNLTLGLILVLWTGLLASLIAALNKYITNEYNNVLWIAALAVLGVWLGSFCLTVYKYGYRGFKETLKTHTTKKNVLWALFRMVSINISFLAFLGALSLGGALGIVYTITSMYILIPIVLAIIFYNEHWNSRKVTAIVLSIVALGFFM